MVKTLILIGTGGAIGSILRYLSAVLVNKYFSGAFPLATFCINMLGCLLIGIAMAIIEKQSWAGNDFKFLFVTGFCGGYTTFSAFAHENISLINGNNTLMAFMYIGASVIAGLLFVWLGILLGKIL